MSSRKRAVVVDVAQFVVLTLALSSLFAVLIVRAGHIARGRNQGGQPDGNPPSGLALRTRRFLCPKPVDGFRHDAALLRLAR